MHRSARTDVRLPRAHDTYGVVLEVLVLASFHLTKELISCRLELSSEAGDGASWPLGRLERLGREDGEAKRSGDLAAARQWATEAAAFAREAAGEDSRVYRTIVESYQLTLGAVG